MLFIASIFSFILCVNVTVAAKIRSPALGIKFDSSSALPTLTLPYGTWRAFSYDSVNDIYLFQNIRFAASPVGNLRWAKPAPPTYNATIQDGSYGPQCLQGQFTGDPIPPASGSEDCLFLDLSVPGCAIRDPDQNLPVVVWTFGGAYIVGSKDDGFTPNGLITVSGNKMIFIAYNYRVGSFGFLAGTTMEQEGLPNAAFYDQRAAYQWVQDYIYLVGGDKDQVTAWGESAGAGSILSHLTAFGGKQDPLFRKAVMQSIATELLVDRRGEIEGIYQEFLAAANCSGQSIACLRAASSETLQAANLKVIADVPPSAFKPGPSSDGKWIRQMPPLELASGNFFPIESLIVSHVENEGAVFVTGQIQTEAAFATLVDFIIPAYAPTVRQAVLNFYPDPSVPGSPYATENARTTQDLDDTNFLCNYRYLNTAYKGKVWSMQYSVPPGLHGSDLTPTFFLGNDTAANISTFTGNLYRDYQSYLTSFSIYGSPDAARLTGDQPPTINWPKSTGEDLENLENVLNITATGFEIIIDGKSLKDRCDFFLSVQAAVTLAGGYVPPGGAVPNDLGVTNPDPSGNYSTPR